MNIANALRSLCPTAEFALVNGILEWHSPDITQPTEAEIQAEITRLQAIEPMKADIANAKKFLAETDWVVTKIAELGLDGTDAKSQYLDVLSQRKLMREVINLKESQIAGV